MAEQNNYEPSQPVDQKTSDAFRVFYNRACRFEENWDDLEQQYDLNKVAIHQNGTLLHTDGLSPNIHRIKGLYLDYRVFETRDQTQLRRVVNNINKHFRYAKVCDLTGRLLEKWDTSPRVVTWSGFSAEELIDTAFYSLLFHSNDMKKLKKMEDFLARSNEVTLHTLILLDIRHRVDCIRWLRHLLTPFSLGEQKLNMDVFLSTPPNARKA